MSVNFPARRDRVLREPRPIEQLLSDPRAGWLWLLPRLWVGWSWLQAGRHKVVDPEWMQTGAALQGYWQRAVAIPESGRPAISFDWYRSFLQLLLDAQAHTWFAKIIAVGEVAVGIALILGAFTAIAAFFGAFMNWNFMMAGSASTNPMLFAFSIGLILGWKVAGYIGLDYYLLPWLGTPWTVREGAGASEKPVPGEAGA